MRQFFTDYFDARSNEQYHNPRTGLRTYILSFTEVSTRLELMQQNFWKNNCMSSLKPILHKKSFHELTMDELYELLLT